MRLRRWKVARDTLRFIDIASEIHVVAAIDLDDEILLRPTKIEESDVGVAVPAG